LVAISQSFGIPFGTDQAHLTCHLSGAFTGLLDVRRMLGELIVLDRGVLVDSSVGVLAITGLRALIVVL
jgi:hypothetical protein